MRQQSKGCIRIIAAVFLLGGTGLLGIDKVGGAITPVDDVLPVYDGISDPWNIGEALGVGFTSDGGLTVSDGSDVVNLDAYLGIGEGVTGTAVITGAGSTWTSSGFVVLGDEGIGDLTIESGGQAISEYGILGEEGTGSGTARVTGAGSSWTMEEWLSVGLAGTGTLDVNDGGLVEAWNVYIGDDTTGEGTVNVTDADSLLRAESTLFVGYDGQGAMEVTGAGQVSSVVGALGYSLGSSGTVTVSGAGSAWDAGSLGVGVFGDGELVITDDGQLTTLESGIAVGADSVATAEVSNGGTWTNTDAMAVGIMGDGTLTIASGGQVTTLDAYIGGMDPEAPNVDATAFLGDDPLDGTGTVEVTGAGSRWDAAGDLYVGYTGTGTLEVGNSGVVTSEYGLIGFEPNGTGTVTVTDDGSQWDVTEVLSVGGAGEGTLTLSNRGLITATDVQVGGYVPDEGFETLADFLDPAAELPEGTGTIEVISEGHLDSDGLSVGLWGDGTLDVNDGGQVTSGWAELGVGPNAVGTAEVRGSTSTWAIDDELTVGLYGRGDLTIAGGGTVSAYDVFIAGAPYELVAEEGDPYDPDLLPDGTGSVIVTGTDSRLSVAGPASLYVGYSGDGTLDVNDGGQVTSDLTIVGGGPDAVGAVTVEDAGSLLSTEELGVGFWGTGTLDVNDGGQVTVREVLVGGGDTPDDLDPDMLADFGDPLGTGTISVTGTGSRLDVDEFLYVGYTGTGTLDVNEGGVVTSEYGAVGADPGSTGTAVITGTDSEWTTAEGLAVGAFGRGTMTIAAGGLVDANEVYVGGFDIETMGDPDMNDIPEGIGVVAVSGTGSQLDVDDFLYVGYTGTGTLDVNDGGVVTSDFAAVGADETSTGTATVTGAGSQWAISQGLAVGAFGDGDLTISDGGEVYASEVYIGGFDTDILDEEIEETPEGTGTVTVTGEDSYLQAGGSWTLYVGYSGDGTLDILDGGTVFSQNSYIGYEEGSTGTVTVTGVGSTWDVSGEGIYIGQSGTGALTISEGGTVTASSAIVGRNADSSGTVLVTGADSLWDIGASLWVGFRGEGELTIADGGQVQSEHGYIADNEAVSVGTVTVTGEDALWLLDGNLYVGGNDTQAAGTGVLAVNDGGRVVADEVTVWETGTLTGDGTVSVTVPTTVHNYGTIAPGDDGVGTLTVDGDVIFHEGSTYEVQIGGAEADKLAVNGDVTIAESTTVQVRSAGTVVGNREYDIIAADSVTGTFDVLDTALLDFQFNDIGLEYDPTTVVLWIDAMQFDDPNLTQTYNQQQVGGAFQEIAQGGGNDVTSALQELPEFDDVRGSYDELAGRTRPSLAPISAAGTARFMGTISHRLRNPGAIMASSFGGSSLSAKAGPDAGYSSSASYEIDTGRTNFAVGNGSPYLGDSKWGLWGKGYGLFGDRDGSDEAPGYDYTTYGAGFGIDYQFTERFLFGLTGGYSDGDVDYDASSGSSDLSATHVGLYGSWDAGRTYVDSLLTYSDLDYETERFVELTDERLEGDFGGYAVSGYFETGFDWRQIQGWQVQPLASFQFSYLDLDDYEETGGDAALGYEDQEYESYIGSLGVKMTKNLLKDSAQSNLVMQFRARWLHEFGDTRSDVNTFFAGDPTVVFNIRDSEIDRDSAVLGVGLGAQLNRNTRLYVDYDTRLNADDTAHLISGGLQYRW